MNDPWRVLLVDDNPDDRISIIRKLRKQFAGMQIEPVTDAQDLVRALETGHFDVVLTECQLGWVDGLAISQTVKARRPACPVIMFTRTGSEEIGVKAIKAGLDDYITKSPKHWPRLLSAVEAALGQARQRQAARSRGGAKKKQIDPAMRTESFVAAVLDTIDALVVALDRQGRIIGFNRACEQTAGYAFHEVKNQFIWSLLPPDEVAVVKAVLEGLRAGQLPGKYQTCWVAKDGSRRLIDWSNTALFNAQGTAEYIIATGIDITERQSAERASQQAQAAVRRRDAILEAVGVAVERFPKLPAWEQHIRQVLERLGNATQASRVYVAHNHSGPDGALGVSRLYEWTAQDITPQIDNLALQNLPLKQSSFARWEELLSQEHIIYGPVKNFPERERVALAQQDVLSVVIVPIFVGKEWWGHIGLDDCAVEREWSSAEIDALKIAADILGATMQREQTEQEIRRRLRETALLNRVIALATSTQDERVVLQTTCQELARAFNLPQCVAAMFGGSYVQATVIAEYITPGRPSMLGTVITVMDDATVKYVLERKEPLAVVDALADPRLEAMHHHSLLQRGTVSLMVIPILLRGDVVGVISLEADKWREFSEEEIALAQSVAAATGQAWENVRLYEAAYNRTRYLATLNEIGQAVTSTLNLDRVLVILLEHVRQATNAEACSVALVEESTGDLVFLHAAGEGSHDVVGMRLKPGQGIAGWVAANREPVLVLEANSDSRFYNNVDEKTGFTTHDLICVPLIARDMVIGVVELLNKREGAFGEGDIRLLESVAAQAAIAVENARLFQRSQAFSDLLQTAAEVSRAASSILDLDQLLPQVVELIRGHFGLYYVGIFLVEESSQYAVLRVGTGEAGRQMLTAGHKLEVGGSSMIGWCVANAQGRIALDVGKEATRFDNPWLPETRSELALPLISRGQVIGAMTVQSAQAAAFSDIHITTLQTIADQVSIAIENARSFENERRRSNELEILRQASLHVTSSLELEPVLEAILNYALDLVQGDDSHVFLYDGERVTFGAARWAGKSQERPFAEPRLGGLTYTVARGGERVVVPNVNQHPLFKGWQGDGAIVGLPLRVGDRVSGVMNIAFNKARTFNENELRLLDLLSDQAAVAIQNARLYGETRRHLQELAIISEVALAGAAGRPFDETVARATDALSRLWTEASLGFLFVDESDMSLHSHSSYHGLPEGAVMRVPLDQGLTGLAVRERRPVKIGDVTTDSHYVGFVPGVRSEMAAPLVIGERAIGVVNVESFKPDAFSGDDLRLLATLAGQLATIFGKAQLDAALAEHTELLERRVEERTAEIRSQQARTQAILDALGEGVVVTDVKGGVLYINPAQETLGGYGAQEAIGQNPRLWQSGQTPPEVYRQMWSAILAAKTWRGELVNKRKDGSLYNASVTIAPIPSTGPNKLAGFVGVQHDITRLKELDRLKSEFVSNVSHELRTPLSNIKLYLGLLEHGKLDSTRYLQYVDVLRREELRLERLIEDLLTLSRLELSKVEAQREVLDLDTLARQLVDDRQALAAVRGLTLLYEAPPDPLPPVWADGAMISQVLTNLISNSMNYTPQGGTITVHPQTQIDESQSPGRWVTVAVQDTGAGISPKDQQHLFERFYRGEAARQTGSPGTGLGLAICQEIVERHNGHITFESQLSQGSTFTVWLPAALDQDAKNSA